MWLLNSAVTSPSSWSLSSVGVSGVPCARVETMNDSPVVPVSEWRLCLMTDKFVHLTRRAGRLFFGEHVHQAIMSWTARWVQDLGLAHREIILVRGTGRARTPEGRVAGACLVPGRLDLPAWVVYAWRLRLRDTITVSLADAETQGSVATLRYVLLHELLHIRYPGQTESWIRRQAVAMLTDAPLQSVGQVLHLPKA